MTDGTVAPVVRRALPHALVWVVIIALNLTQQPGLITFDTKLDLQLAPSEFLARSTSLWTSDWALGGLQNQASGYLFPMSPVFVVGEWLNVPMWIWERLWSALVMLLAYEGMRRLAARWPGIAPRAAILAGLAYMLAPRVLTTAGTLSGETLAGAVLPWTVLPLVLHLRGHLTRRVAFVLSAATIPWMGGQNATVTIACLLAPAILLAGAADRTVRRRLGDLVGWGCLVAVATSWWLVPLLLQGIYAPPFLDFIETARNTAGDTGWLSSLRGTSHWVAFLPGGGRLGWTGGHEVVSSVLVLFTSVGVALLGLVGLLRQGLWQRRVLVMWLLCGLAVLTAGSGGWAGSLLSESWLHALDTTLAPLRNIHKFDPLVRLPLALGVAAWASTEMPQRLRLSLRAPLRSAQVAGVVLVVAAASWPAWNGHLRTDDGFEDISESWRKAAAYLTEQAGPTRTLLLPGGTFAVQTWGRTIDEPMQVLQPGPWVARAQLAVSTPGTIRVVEALEATTDQARPQASLAAELQGLGITHVIVRDDQTDDPDAADAAAVGVGISQVPGARQVASFGEDEDGTALEVWELDHDPEPRVDLLDWEERVVVSGSPEVLPELVAAGLVDEDQAAVLATGDAQPQILTDSLRRVERNFGRAFENRSGVLTAEESFRVDRQAHDLIDDTMPEGLTTAAYEGVARIEASSSAGVAGGFGGARPDQHPYSAFDSSIYTSWVTAPLSEAEGQWVEVQFDEPTAIDEVSLTFDKTGGAAVTSVRISTPADSVTADVPADGVVSRVGLDDDAATSLRVEVVRSGGGQVMLSDVRIEGVEVSRSLVLPGSLASDGKVLMSSEAPRRACAVAGDSGDVTCVAGRFRDTSESADFDRTLTVGERGTWRLGGSVMATYGPALDRLFAPLQDNMVSVVASSTFGGDPAVNPAGAWDGHVATSWLSSGGESAPVLDLRWGPKRRVTRIEASLGEGSPGVLPERFLVDAGPGTGEPQVVSTSGSRAGQMRPVRTDHLRLTALGDNDGEPFGITELDIAGIEDLRNEPDLSGPTGTLCGFGPTVEVDGRAIQTRVQGTLDDVRSGAELELIPCDAVHTFSPGQHRVRVVNPSGFTTTQLTMVPSESAAALTSLVQPDVQSWGATQRTVRVDALGESVLGVRESFNSGWRAVVGDTELEPVVLDGWRQGFVVPAGTDGVVALDYEPQGLFRASLLGGMALAVLLMLAGVVLLVITLRRRPAEVVHGDPDRERPRHGQVGRLASIGLALVLVVVSIPLAVGAAAGWATRGLSLTMVSATAAVALLVAAAVAAASSSVVVAPRLSDVMAAFAVGLVCGRAMRRT